MVSRTALALAVALVSSTAFAQHIEPAKQLSKLDRFLGHWSGTGTASQGPGQPAMPWEARSTFKKVFNGHAIQEDMRITFGGAFPGAIEFRNFFGWDAGNGKMRQISATNMGSVEISEVAWDDDDTMVQGSLKMEDGRRVVERWTTSLGKDSYSFVGHKSVGSEEFFESVKGKMTRVAKPGPALGLKNSFMVPPSEEMKKLRKMAGVFSIKGGMVMEGMGEMDIAGVNTQKLVWSGTVMFVHTKGAPPTADYEAWSAMGWNPSTKCYLTVYCNNMGEIGSHESRWHGDKLVTSMAMFKDGQQTVGNTVTTFGKDGPKAAVAHTVTGAAAPVKSFWMNYKRVNGSKPNGQ